MQKRVSKDILSNCFLLALWLKLRHCSKVKIMHRSAIMNWRRYGVFCPHFYAKHGEFEYHFHTDRDLKFPQYLGIFKGYVRVLGKL